MTTDTDGVIYSPESDQNKNKIKNHKNEKKPGTRKIHLVESHGETLSAICNNLPIVLFVLFAIAASVPRLLHVIA